MEAYNLRPVWNGILSIFDVFQSICERNHLRFYMAYGSALGTVRHQGFIPWDDDLDVCMPLEDYRRFMEIAPMELPEYIKIIGWRTNPTYQCNFNALQDTRGDITKQIEKESGLRLRSVYMDIFPIVGTPPTAIGFWLWMIEWTFLQSVEVLLLHRQGKKRKGFHTMLGLLMSWFNGIKTRDRLREAVDHWLTKSPFVGRRMTTIPFTVRRWRVPTCFWGKPVMMEFEGRKVPLPKEYNRILREYYGNYMRLPPPEKRHPSHPAFVDSSFGGNGNAC